MPPKRQKIDSPNSSAPGTSYGDLAFGTEWKSNRMKKELESLRLKISLTEAAAIQHHKLRKQTEDLFVREKNILEMQVQRDAETIKQLEKDLGTAMRRAHEACVPQLSVESEMARPRATIQQRITKLATKNLRLEDDATQSTSPRASDLTKLQEENREALEKLVAAEKKISELEKTIDENLTSQAEVELQSLKLQQAKIMIHRLSSTNRTLSEREKLSTAHIKELEKEIESSKDKLAMLSDVVKEKVVANEGLEKQISILKEKLKNRERLQAQLAILRDRCGELSSKLLECKKEENVPGSEALQSTPQQAASSVAAMPLPLIQLPKSQVDAWQKGSDKTGEDLRRSRAAKRKSAEMTRRNIEDFDDVQSVVDGNRGRNEDKDSSWNVPDDEESFSDNQSDEDDCDSLPDENEDGNSEGEPTSIKQPDENLRVQVGQYYSVIVSSSQFFTIKWQFEYKHREANRWVCKKCDVVETSRNKIEDHIWVVHYDGHFTCPLCTYRPRLLQRRDSIRQHVKKAHPEKYRARKRKV
ncbi:COP1-interactive protein 1-like [Diachasma alloeum]|uniref:COP1-interactive protein 1-like n=1 Tax=Diachasma alloeum TaxID=454923 RepID=UPI0007383E96|nr:COP1-interactive protein 1-like [Diachasma alloeum]